MDIGCDSMTLCGYVAVVIIIVKGSRGITTMDNIKNVFVLVIFVVVFKSSSKRGC